MHYIFSFLIVSIASITSPMIAMDRAKATALLLEASHIRPVNDSDNIACLDQAKKAISAGANIDARGEAGYTALHNTTLCNNYNLAVLLLEKGADVNALNNAQQTPLHLLTSCNRKISEFIRLLCENGADVYAEDYAGCNPLYQVTGFGFENETAAETLLEYGARSSYFFSWASRELSAIESGDVPLKAKKKEYLTRVLSFNPKREELGHLLLEKVHARSLYPTAHSLAPIKLLIAQRALCNVADSNGKTPLHYAVQGISQELPLLLLEGGADINALDDSDCNPLHLTTSDQIREALLNAGADMYQKNNRNASTFKDGYKLAQFLSGTPFAQLVLAHHEQNKQKHPEQKDFFDQQEKEALSELEEETATKMGDF